MLAYYATHVQQLPPQRHIHPAQDSGNPYTIAANSTVDCADGYKAAILGEQIRFETPLKHLRISNNRDQAGGDGVDPSSTCWKTAAK